MKKVHLAINGFGRIGRSICKIIQNSEEIEIVAINDICKDIKNLSYLYNYDSTYGVTERKSKVVNNKLVIQDGKSIPLYSEKNINKVPWGKHQVDIIIDTSGSKNNVDKYQDIIKKKSAGKIIIPSYKSSPLIDQEIILGYNEEELLQKSNTISTGICDSNATVHVIDRINSLFGVDKCHIVTLHPWLSYQNLMDNYLTPAFPWENYALARSAVHSLIPKDTSLTQALLIHLKYMKDNLNSISYRVPTDTVSSAVVNIHTKTVCSQQQLKKTLVDLCKDNEYIKINTEPLISVDYKKQKYSTIIDLPWTKVTGDKLLSILLWYDNEWGYASRIIDLVKLIQKKFLQEID